MTNIFISKWHGDRETVEKIHVFEINGYDEYVKFTELTDKEKLNYVKIENKANRQFQFYCTNYYAVVCERKLRKDV